MPIAIEFVPSRRKKIAVDVVPAEWQLYIAQQNLFYNDSNPMSLIFRDVTKKKTPQGTGVFSLYKGYLFSCWRELRRSNTYLFQLGINRFSKLCFIAPDCSFEFDTVKVERWC